MRRMEDLKGGLIRGREDLRGRINAGKGGPQERINAANGGPQGRINAAKEGPQVRTNAANIAQCFIIVYRYISCISTSYAALEHIILSDVPMRFLADDVFKQK